MQIPNFLFKRGITQILTFDYETFYSKDYTLRKMSTSLYIFDEQFLVHGLGINLNGVTNYYRTDANIREALSKVDWAKTAVLAHHCQFDGLILFYRYGIKPAYYLDTLSMARPVLQNEIKKLDLDSIAKHIGITGKLEGLEDTKGKRELTLKESIRLGIYCKNDVDITIPVYDYLLPHFTEMELDVIHLTIKMYADPKLIVDEWLIDKELIYIHKQKKEMFDRVKSLFPAKYKNENTVTILRSGDKLAEVLQYNGIESPTKTSATTGKITHAFARTDLDFQKLGSCDNPTANLLYNARLTSKSDTALNKAIILKKFAHASCCPVYLNYWKAQTGRFSGGDKIQLQNLTRGGVARLSLLAPEEHVLVVCDLSQVELRMSAWFAGQQDVLDIFIGGKDVYKDMATKIYNIPYTEVTKPQRMVAKVTCVSARTQVLTDNGYKPIVEVLLTDKVWNGKKWVTHRGVIRQGYKKTKNLLGVSITADHLVSCGNAWRAVESLLQNVNTLHQALNRPTENFPSLDIYLQKKKKGTRKFWLNVHAQMTSIQQVYTALLNKISSTAKTTHAWRPLKHVIEQQWQLCQTLHLENDYLIDFHQQFHDTLITAVPDMQTAKNEELLYIKLGEQVKVLSLHSYKLLKAGIIQNYKWVEQTVTETMNQAIYSSLPKKKTCLTDETQIDSALKPKNGMLQSCKNDSANLSNKELVYDLLDCAEGNKFTILTAGGPIIVHNCLGLGYGAGIPRFAEMLKTGAMGPKVDLPYAEVGDIHTKYRKANSKIVNTWRLAGKWLEHMLEDTTLPPAKYKGLTFSKGQVKMPNGTLLRYPNMRVDFMDGVTYSGANGIRKRIYSSLFYENIIQSLARHVIAEQLVHVAKKYDVVLSVHDELIVSVHFTKLDKGIAFIKQAMRTSPNWCKTLPLDCEAGWDISYSK